MAVTITGLDQVLTSMANAAQASRDLGSARAEISATAPYARFVHDGTPAHTIRPRAKKALFWPGAAHPMRAVEHPGYKGNPFMTNALDARAPEVAGLIGAALAAVAEGGPESLVPQAFYNGGILIELDARAKANYRDGKLRQSITARVFGR